MYSNIYKGIHLTFEEQINLSAHNHNIVDIEFTTKPKIQIQEMKEKLHIYNLKNNITTNKIALTVVIMEYLVFKINPDFPGGEIKKALKQLCKYKTDEEAEKIGFSHWLKPHLPNAPSTAPALTHKIACHIISFQMFCGDILLRIRFYLFRFVPAVGKPLLSVYLRFP